MISYNSDMKHKTLTLIRGLPGSGKSTLAKSMKIANDLEGNTTFHYEADQFFEDVDGNYNFDASKLHYAHQQCHQNTEKAMMGGYDVIVANTFTTMKEIRPYTTLAEKYDYNFEIIDATGNYSSIHNVPEEAIERMRNRWLPTADVYSQF